MPGEGGREGASERVTTAQGLEIKMEKEATLIA